FCNALVSQSWEIEDEKISENIRDKYWFNPIWDKDPTINSMLRVLDKIHEKFKNIQISIGHLDEITFEYVDMENFSLDEELYIRMNSTGKPLTDFEIWKAKFETFIQNTCGAENDLLKHFQEKIDTEWIDSFWQDEDYKNEIKVDGESYYSTDEAMLNFFHFITEMLGYKSFLKNGDKNIKKFYEAKDLKGEFTEERIFKLIYSDKKNLKFLIRSFDKFKDINGLSKNIFGTFYESEEDYNRNKDKLPVVDKKKNPHLLKVIVAPERGESEERERAGYYEKVMLFALIEYVCRNNNTNQDNLKDFLRILRNLLLRIRYEERLIFEYRLDIRREDLHEILKFIDEILSKLQNNSVYSLIINWINKNKPKRISLKQEKDKAEKIKKNPDIKEYIHKLEDHIYVKGDLTNFLYWDDIPFKEKAEKLYKTFERKDEEIIPVLLSLNCKEYPRHYGNRFFFGREGFWDVIVVGTVSKDKDKTYECLWKELFTHKDFDNFEKIRKEFLNTLSSTDWKYYFAKYNKIFAVMEVKGMRSIKDKNIFLMPYGKEDDLSIYAEKLLRDWANSYHVNPFIYYICENKEISTSWAEEGKHEKGIRWGYGVRDTDDFYSYIVLNRKRVDFLSLDGDKNVDLIEALEELLSKLL
ncbi:hypothetical protein, partial [Persephonella sp.]